MAKSPKQVYTNSSGKERVSNDAVITFLDTLYKNASYPHLINHTLLNKDGEYTAEAKFEMSDLEKQFTDIFETLIVNQWHNEFQNIG